MLRGHIRAADWPDEAAALKAVSHGGAAAAETEPTDTAEPPAKRARTQDAGVRVHRQPAASPGDEEALFIDAAIDKVEGDFRMRLDAANGRPAQTVLRVVERGTFQGSPVTKVRLKLLTGRRHQLRLHTLAVGHPIVGDFTYASAKARGEGEAAAAAAADTEPRMMLHSASLVLHLAKSKKARKRDRNGKPVFAQPEGGVVSADAGDPFPFVDGVLVPKLPPHMAAGAGSESASA